MHGFSQGTKSQCPSGHFVLFYKLKLTRSDRKLIAESQCPSGHFVLFYRGLSAACRSARSPCLNALPGILFFSTLGGAIRPKKGTPVSMPFRAFCSFLRQLHRVGRRSLGRVSMPFRAFCSFLPQLNVFERRQVTMSQCPSGHFVLFYLALQKEHDWTLTGLNALPGILFFSTPYPTLTKPSGKPPKLTRTHHDGTRCNQRTSSPGHIRPTAQIRGSRLAQKEGGSPVFPIAGLQADRLPSAR